MKKPNTVTITPMYGPGTRLDSVSDPVDRRAVISASLLNSRRNIETDAGAMVTLLDDIRAHRGWEYLDLPDEAALVQEYYGKTLDQVGQIVAGVNILRAAGVAGPIGEKQALSALAKNTGRSLTDGGDRRSEAFQSAVSENGTLKRGSNKRVTRIARLKRDHPDIGQRLEAGEFRNVRDAERAAGLPVPPKLTALERVLSSFRRLTAADQAAFRAAIGT